MARQVKTRASKRKPAEAQQQRAEAVSQSRIDGLVDGYLESLRVEHGYSEHTIRNYQVDLQAFLMWCGRRNVDPLKATHRELRAYLGEMDAAQYARTTVNRRLSSMRGFYRWMNLVGATDSDPAEALSGPKRGKHLPHVLKQSEMERLLAVHGPVGPDGKPREQTPEDMRDQALLEFLYACGARISEAAGLKLQDVDFQTHLVKLFGKGRKERIVPLHDLCVDAMRAYVRDARPLLLKKGEQTDSFFVSNKGNPMSADSMRKRFKATVRAAGLDDRLSPHDMRHTFATDLLDGQADLRSVQEMLGHASLSTTQVYTHLSTTRLKDAHHQAHPRA
ncbi:MAG: tyrosine recombinase [Eggerthellaceae bacterium]|nr:tyrosine recombinase [Eggerthellaceae bacterium]